jgi:uncharacterized membrane protein
VNPAQTISLAATSGGWWIGGMAICMLMMGVMMFAMMGHGRAKNVGARWWPGGWPGSREERPIEVLERRFAEGDISVEDYRQRREELTNGAGGVRVDAGISERTATADATRAEEP